MKEIVPVQEAAVEYALATPASREIVARCIRRPKAVKDISKDSGLALATTYRHVNALLEKGVLLVERSAMTKDGKPYDLYRSRLRSATISLTEKGTVITWELNVAVEDRLADFWGQLGGHHV